MSPPSRDNHYVPKWHQKGFLEPGANTLVYLDMAPPTHTLPDGRIVVGHSTSNRAPSRSFVQFDLYSTFFGTSVNDEIERKLFGATDTRGTKAVKAFTTDDKREWHRYFQALFDYIDIQKARTPKGLDWLRAQYPSLTQNELMMEMQGVRRMNCTIWTEGVREIISAEDAGVKFILTDHPVTVYNAGLPPGVNSCAYPDDPSIALKGSQTLFPLSRDFCLILTNLEYARDPAASPMEKRTFSRNYRNSMVRTDAFIRDRKLTDHEVCQINSILKARAKRYVAAGREDFLFPERVVQEQWPELRRALQPPKNSIWNFGGEIYARFDDGRVHYQDEFGRTEKPFEELQKASPAHLRSKDPCGCGSDKPFKDCCASRPKHLRPTWNQLSIRERNLALYRAVVHILGITPETDWVDIRRAVTDEKIAELYGVFQAFWPLETDLLQLLPKPDGQPRAIYTGSVHPSLISEFAVGASLYFGEVLIEHPFIHARTHREEFNPIDNPQAFRQEILKSTILFLTLIPLINCGLVNLVPDLCNFDFHLRDQILQMAKERSAVSKIPVNREDRTFKVMRADMQRSLLLLPSAALRRMLAKGVPGLEALSVDEMLATLEQMRLHDPLVSLQKDSLDGKDGGQFSMQKMAPNFEMAMYLAQATGACIITDSRYRWLEIQAALKRRRALAHNGAPALAVQIENAAFLFPQNEIDVANLYASGNFAAYPSLIHGALKYLAHREQRGAKPNFEAQLAAKFTSIHTKSQAALERMKLRASPGRIKAVLPAQGIQDNTVNRLLLMSSSEHHLASVPMAFFIERSRTSRVNST